MTTTYASRHIIIANEGDGWFTRCTEFDANGDGIGGRIAMDEGLDASTMDEAMLEAAEHWGCDPEEIERYTGSL